MDSISNEILQKHALTYISELGRGGFGSVIAARHNIDGNLYAIKKLLITDKEEQNSFIKEIKLLSRLSLPNIVNYKQSFLEDGDLYLVMEYCGKGTLHDRIKEQNGIHEDELVRIFLKLIETFAKLHEQNIIHHDIKPSNILISDDDEPLISDFGCANTRIGTTIYYAPEQNHDANAHRDPRVDIYSLGISLLEAALGHHPLSYLSKREQIRMIKNADLPVGSLPYWLQELILKACHFNPELRFQSMQEFHKALLEKDIPKIIESKHIEDEKLARKIATLVNFRKWESARKVIHTGINSKNLNQIIQSGKYYLGTHKLDKARECFEDAMKLNSNAAIEKEIAEVYIQTGEPSKAASVLQNYLHRNFFDMQAHNQLLHTYFLSKKWDLGYEHALLILDRIAPNELIFENNLFVFDCLIHDPPWYIDGMDISNPFTNYNYRSVLLQNDPESWYRNGKPHLSSKLLFQEYKIKSINTSKNELLLIIDGKEELTSEKIISFGRKGYDYNSYSGFKGTDVSRRHFVIINQKNNVWLYDLDSTGIWVDDEKVNKKHFLLGLHTIRFGSHEISIKTNAGMLL